MEITLISLDPELYCYGVRVLSASLRQAGHQVNCVFLPPVRAEARFQSQYSPRLLGELTAIAADSRLVGISLMTNQYLQACDVTSHLKRHGISAPVIWGGIQPTVEPEECLAYADIVCVGEGEGTLVELADRMARGEPYSDVGNLWIKAEGDTIRNPVRPLELDLDSLPLPDYSCVQHYLGTGDRLEQLTRERLVGFQGERYRSRGDGIFYPVITSRGCPFACTYCCNSVYDRLYHRQKRLRWRSPGNVVREIQMIGDKIARPRFVFFVDDNFTARPIGDLAAFCEAYREQIGVPFACQVSPLTISAERMDLLLSAGCVKVTMGVETASPEVASMYNRTNIHRSVPKALALVEQYRPRLAQPPTYQFIVDNPYETLDQTIETLRLASSLARPWDNPVYSLMLFPGTPMYERALRDGLIVDKRAQIYGRNWLDHSRPYLQLWIRLYRANAPAILLRTMLLPWIARALTGTVASAALRTPALRWLWRASR